MDFARLNPYVRSVTLYEKLGKSDMCVAYDARLIYLISGEIKYKLSDAKVQRLAPGNLLYIPAGTPYSLKAKYVRCVVVSFDLIYGADSAEDKTPVAADEFDASRLCDTGDITPFDKAIFAEDFEADRDEFIALSEISLAEEGLYSSILSARIKLLLIRLAETSDEHALPARMVDALGQYIRENCQDEISNTELGAIFGYHPFYVSRLLKEKKGTTMRQYVISYRLKRAKALLRSSDKSAGEIGAECGFTDASYFTKTFRGALGITPKEYRNGFKDTFI